MKNYDANGCLNLMMECVSQCFTGAWRSTETKEDRKRFANSKLVSVFADCTENFEPTKLRKLIEKTL